MNPIASCMSIARYTVTAVLCATTSGCADPAPDSTDSGAAVVAGADIDNFNDPEKNSLGIARQFVDDTAVGGATKTQHSVKEGVLLMKGEISPPRGQPGWASATLLLDPEGLPQDASAYHGVRLLVRINKGTFSITANSSKVTNFDFHAAPVASQSDGKFHEVKIPFSRMKRAWSEQSPLDTGTLASLSLVAVGMQKGAFDFEIDEIGFYQK